MMSISASSSTLPCGSCQYDNLTDAQFCGGCGHVLFEDCGGCGRRVGLTQKFCVGCGKDLQELLQQRFQQHEKRLAEAVVAAKTHHFRKSLSILEHLADVTDFRFAAIVKRATEAMSKVSKVEEKTTRDAEARMQQAAKAFNAERFNQVIEILSQVPAVLLSEDAANQLSTAKTHLDQTGSLQQELQTALSQKNYMLAAGLLQQLLELMPTNQKYNDLAKQLGTKLLSSAEKKFTRQDYAGASQTLHMIPDQGRSDAYQSMVQRIETTRWLSEQFPHEPFASATLGRLAIRFAKEVPSDGYAAGLVKELQTAVKGRRPSARDGFAPWKGADQSWMGGRLGMLAQPQSIDMTKLEDRPASMTEYAAAIGLAVQGLGLSRVTGNLVVKKGMFAKLTSSKSKLVWGIDIGSSAIHAIQLRLDKVNEKPIVVAAHTVPLKNPTCRGGGLRVHQEEIQDAVKTLLEKINLEGSTVWTNLVSSESVARFVELPPVKDKEADRLIDLEAKHRIPIASEDLMLIVWRASMDKKAPRGRPVVMAAATKITVSRRIDLIEGAGLKLDGMVPDGVALANFVAFEFANELKLDDAPESATDGESGKVISDDEMPTIALVDAGASKTMLVMVSPISVWYWSQESGGEDATSIVSRHFKKTAAEADQLKRNLAAMELPDVVDHAIADRQDALRMRMIKLREEAEKAFRHVNVTGVWCVGGAQLQHGFYRRVLAKDPKQNR